MVGGRKGGWRGRACSGLLCRVVGRWTALALRWWRRNAGRARCYGVLLVVYGGGYAKAVGAR